MLLLSLLLLLLLYRIILLTLADGCDLSANLISWFEGGVANVTETCVDQHLGKNKIALIWEKDEPGNEEYVTYEVQAISVAAVVIVVIALVLWSIYF